ncbi:putative lipid II flippase FtsW [Epidermidibacterium keratini]|uniref:putative lipid II flippase FtsW n=1 Tax=Epidermidibacterium keratini TaxID=1891644 RepID=UPI001CEF621F|nr:putative lipid II flippase FtsW [Epidermidibacterium keratini]
MANKAGTRSAWSRLDPAALRRTGAQARAGASARVSEVRGFLRKPLASFYLVLMLTAALVAFGLVMMASASAVDSMVTFGSPYYLFTRQLIFVGMGIAALVVALRMRLQTLRRLSPMMMIVSMVLLALVLVPGIGVEIYGARRWFDLGITLFQPSEFGKVAFLIWGAHVLVQRKKLLDTWGGLLKPILPGLAILAGLIVIEPDLHTTVVYLIIFLALLWVVGTPMRLFGLLGIGAVCVGVIAIASQGFRLTRVTSFLNPWSDPEGAGHQALQGFYALGTGGLFGVGLGNSRTKWGALPNSHSDYIFAIIGEELGMVGALTVLALFVALAYTGMRIAHRTSDLFIRLVSSATVVWLCAQALINVGYVVGLLPVTGITLPLISSGGTSLVVTMFAMGVLASCARHEPAAVRYLQTRRRRFGRLLSLPVPASPTVTMGREPAPRRTSPSTARRTPAKKTTSARSGSSQRRAPARSAPPRRRPAARTSQSGAKGRSTKGRRAS